MSSIVPYNFNFPKPSPEQTHQYKNTFADPGQAMAQAFAAAITPSKPKYEPPPIKLSKDAQRIRDIQYNLSTIPSYEIKDDRPQTQGELNAKLNPVMITEPLLQHSYDCYPNNYSQNANGEHVTNYDFQEVPINGMPDIRM